MTTPKLDSIEGIVIACRLVTEKLISGEMDHEAARAAIRVIDLARRTLALRMQAERAEAKRKARAAKIGH